MKGVLFNVAQDVVDQTLDDDSWDRALRSSCVRGAYTSLGNYPDEELIAIVAAISEQTGLSTDDVLRHVGLHGFEHLVGRRPELMDGIQDLGTLLHHLEHVIHPEVQKLDPDAELPSFQVTDDGPGTWHLTYRSRRHLCALAEGLIQGAALRFDTPVRVEQPTCWHSGDDHCVIVVTTV